MDNLNLFYKNLNYLRSKGVTVSKKQITSLFEFSVFLKSTPYTADQLLTVDIEAKEKATETPIKFLVMDCDGVLTNGAMIFFKKWR